MANTQGVVRGSDDRVNCWLVDYGGMILLVVIGVIIGIEIGRSAVSDPGVPLPVVSPGLCEPEYQRIGAETEVETHRQGKLIVTTCSNPGGRIDGAVLETMLYFNNQHHAEIPRLGEAVPELRMVLDRSSDREGKMTFGFHSLRLVMVTQ